MKLLICTQAVDLDDPVLGFFHRWIAEFSRRFETVHVICLKEGRHELPKNVFVHSLGKEKGRSRITYVLNFYRYSWKFHREYDAVFVHMNQEYVLLGAPLWNLLRKRVSMWRNHYAGSFLTRTAVFFCDNVFCTSKNSYTARFAKSTLMPVGIDTAFFAPAKEAPKPGSILFLGRLDPTKRVHVFVRALKTLHEQGVSFFADIVGDPSDPASNYAHDVRSLAASLCLENVLAMQGAVTNNAARDLFRSHAIYCNLSKQGHFDKTMLEAAACGALVVATNDALREMLPETLIPVVDDVGSTARSLQAALEMPEEKRRMITQASRAHVEREHSLSLLAERLFGILSA
jgi:glycosyltransferase involved in cell wall biosynthesis